MRTLKKLTILLLLGLFLPTADNSFGHGTHFHSLKGLAIHIQKHLTELEILQAQPEPDDRMIRQTCEEIVIHAKEYQLFSLQIKREKQFIKIANTLELMSIRLIESAQKYDLSKSIQILKGIQNLIHPAL